MLGECAVSKKKTIGIIAGRIMGIVTVATHIYKNKQINLHIKQTP